MPSAPALPQVSAATARRVFLDVQGLAADPRRAATPAAVYELVERMGFVQMDSINVVERAHHLTLAARLDGYRPPLLRRLLERERSLFEGWTHDASAIPTVWFPYWKLRFARHTAHGHPWWRQRLGPDPEGVMARALDRITREGPLGSKDFAAEVPAGAGSWWGWRPEKAALEHLWRVGRLAVARRVHFNKVYDLTERVLPAAAAARRPSAAEHLAWACRGALERLGFATAQEIADFWDAVTPAEAKRWCERSATRREIVPVLVGTADGSRPRPAFALPDWEERAAAAAEAPARLRLLSPFDPILRDRRRTQRLFAFDYRLEVFVPAPARKHGYYVLPILEGDRLVGRVDPKLDRKASRLEIRRVWWEPGVRTGAARRAGLEAAVARLARTVGAESYRIGS